MEQPAGIIEAPLQEILLRHLKKHGHRKISPLERAALAKEKLEGEKIFHGTTTLALKYSEGVIIAADTRCVEGSTIASDDTKKIDEIEPLACVASAGYVCDIQILVELLRDEILPEIRAFWDTDIYVAGQAKIAKEIMRAVCLWAWPIFAGWEPGQRSEPDSNKARIFSLEPFGAFFEHKNFFASGSGGDFAEGVLMEKWSQNCPVERGVEIAIHALMRAGQKNINTANPIVSTPTIRIISAKEISTPPPDQIFEIAIHKAMEEYGRQGKKGGVAEFLAAALLEEEQKKGRKKKKGKENDNPKP